MRNALEAPLFEDGASNDPRKVRRILMEVTMRKLIIAVVLVGAALLIGLSGTPMLAAGAGSYAKLPHAATTLRPGFELAGYKHCDHNGCYYCQRRECDDYYYSYGKKYCKHYDYYECAPYGGGGGGGY